MPFRNLVHPNFCPELMIMWLQSVRIWILVHFQTVWKSDFGPVWSVEGGSKSKFEQIVVTWSLFSWRNSGMHMRHVTTSSKLFTEPKFIPLADYVEQVRLRIDPILKKHNLKPLKIASKNSGLEFIRNVYCSYKLTNTIPQIFSLYPLVAFCI